MSISDLPFSDNCRFVMPHVSRFIHAFRAAIAGAGISKSQAATLAGLKQSAVSRFLSGDRPVYADHVAALIKALPNQSDREHCVLAWIRDQCPPDLQDRLIAHFGSVQERQFNSQPDDLEAAVAAIRRAAADGNIAARKVVINLAKAVDPDPPDKSLRIRGGGPPDTISKSA